jgi:hypothetical protein
VKAVKAPVIRLLVDDVERALDLPAEDGGPR